MRPDQGRITEATVFRALRAEGLVAGHYLPLADNHGVAPRSDQTGSLQSDQRTLQSRRALQCSRAGGSRDPPTEKGPAQPTPLFVLT
jgi:hypothetical protein